MASSAEIKMQQARATQRQAIRHKRAETLTIARRMRHIVMDDRVLGHSSLMLDYNEGFAAGLRTNAKVLREIERSL